MTSPSTSTAADLSKQWITLTDDELTEDFALKCFDAVVDDVWVAAACVDRLVEDANMQRTLLEIGIKRSEPALRRTEVASEGAIEDGDGAGTSVEARKQRALTSYFQDEPADAQLCRMRATLLERLDRLNTFVEVCNELPLVEEETAQDEIDEEWEDDPWGETAEGSKTTAKTMAEPPVPLSSFLVDDLVDIACIYASLKCYSAVRVLIERHASSLWQHRFVILDSIPEHVPPTDFRDILPSLDVSSGTERVIQPRAWREEEDWVEQPFVQEALKELDGTGEAPIDLSTYISALAQPKPLSSDALTQWYLERVDKILTNSGMLDNALSLVQHAASQGIAGMDEVGEELSLLSRLVYETPSELSSSSFDWTLDRWKKLDPPAVVRAYLANTPPDDIPKQINKLVMPYLFVLESRAERAGHPDPQLANRLLHEYILQASLEIVAAIFEASKPTLPPAQRLLRDDEDMVRLALACLYGSDSLDEWPTMSRIFECLPAWEVPDDEDEADEADTTVTSLGAFVTPSTEQPRATPSDLLLFFQPLPQHSLSRALDILDVHLESGEILSRWSVPAPLRWFLQSNGNLPEQRAWATRMARQAGGQDDELESLEDWQWLLDDMLKLSGSGESGLKGAFCLLSGDEILRIYLGGLLSTGREYNCIIYGYAPLIVALGFDVARSMLKDSKSRLKLPAATVEEVCIASSQEFYDNASSGNYHFGDMKLAYDW